MGQTGDGGSLRYEMRCLSRGLRLSAGYDAYAKDTAGSSGGGESRVNAPNECKHVCVAGPLFAVVSSPPVRIRNHGVTRCLKPSSPTSGRQVGSAGRQKGSGGRGRDVEVSVHRLHRDEADGTCH